MAGPGGGKKQGLLPKNGCVRLVIFYVGSVLLVALGFIILASGVLANLPVIGSTLGSLGSGSSTTTGSSINSNGIVAVNIPSLSSGGGPTTSGTTSTGSQIASRQAASPQGGVLTSWFSSAFYIAQPGDTLDSIAANFGTTAAVLRQYNPTLTEPIVGKVIFLPPTSSGGGGTLPGTGRNSTP
jgi:LysM repeat protein